MKATNEELTTAVIKLTSTLATMMEFNVMLAKIAIPLATHINEAEKYKATCVSGQSFVHAMRLNKLDRNSMVNVWW
jgi:hypothetical protein